MKETKIREYNLTEELIKEGLNLEGDIQGMELWKGLTPIEENEDKSHNKVRWIIITKEVMHKEKKE